MLKMMCGIELEFQRKDIKKVNLRIRKDGSILLTAPMRVPIEKAEAFVYENLGWIEEHRTKVLKAYERRQHRYDIGSTVHILGHPFLIRSDDGAEHFVIDTESSCVICPRNCTSADTERFMSASYRRILTDVLSESIPRWEETMGLRCSGWSVRSMETKWGTCNIRTGRICFSINLGPKMIEDIDYVIVHELAHLLVDNHGPDFKRLVSAYIPNWKVRKERLNSGVF